MDEERFMDNEIGFILKEKVGNEKLQVYPINTTSEDATTLLRNGLE